MQISRHWRLNAQRYRLEGFRNSNGQVSLQPRPTIQQVEQNAEEKEAQKPEDSAKIKESLPEDVKKELTVTENI